jgi:hypothetical protein
MQQRTRGVPNNSFATTWAARNLVPGEQVLVTLVGFPEGTPKRRMQRLLFGVVLGIPLGVLVGAVTGLYLLPALVPVAVVILVFANQHPLGVLTTDQRVVVLQRTRGQESEVLGVHTRESVRDVSIVPNVEPFWFGGLGRLVFASAEGPFVTLDIPRIDLVATRTSLAQAGIPLAPPQG